MAKDIAPDLTGQLTFDNDKGAGRSKWIAVFLALALVAWMGSGYILPSAPEEETAEAQTINPVAVAVMSSMAQDIDLVLTAEGQSLPDRATSIEAKASGQVISVSVSRGDLVEAGQEIGRIDDQTISAQLAQAKAQWTQANDDLNRAVTLQERGIGTENQVTQARAARASAEAAVTAAQEQLDNTIIRAPFAGRLNEMTLDVGEFANDGDVVAEVLDNDPLTVVVQVPQQALSRLKKGQPAQVAFITGETHMGQVGFIGSNADSQTRTFRVEIIVDNPGSEMPAGLSASIAIPTGQARGHFISPAILSLGPNGELGIKTVLDDNQVAFRPVMIVRAQTDGVWVSGLEEEAQIITVGQGFVSAGDIVDPRVSADQQAAVVGQ
ncbi:efflux RND transporter periplasmic adaptor subunit [Yoonia sp. SS1-5]|uniref:Efflux RND transporter periplasmic adaptor subunit n=1 Tax=Yoonia rhodophyticola TaxID=3137370 RepID=A0AAN0MAC9_9RHOB